MRWTITRQVLDQIVTAARAARPRECCGVLIGTPGHIAEAREAPNLSPDPHRFELDPQAHVRAIRETRGTAQSVLGFYHSHPHSAPLPSARDLAESTYPDAIHIIVGFMSPDADVAETRAFRLDPTGYDELSLSVVAQPSATAS